MGESPDIRLCSKAVVLDALGYRGNIFVDTRSNVEVISRHDRTSPVRLEDAVPYAQRCTLGETRYSVDIRCRSSLRGGNIRGHWLDVVLVNRFRIFFVGLSNDGMCDSSTNGRDDVGFKNVSAVDCEVATDRGLMVNVRRADPERIGGKYGDKDEE